MAFYIVSEDITKMEVDAVVNAANSALAGGGGVDGAIHRAAGPELDKACREYGGCATGDAVITWGFNMDAIYIIHTVGPIWHGGGSNEEALLRSCYRKSMELAETHGVRTVAFPLISGGVYGYPKEAAITIAVEELTKAAEKNTLGDIYLTLTDKAAFEIAKKKFPEYLEN
ncbi:MAG: O-acetyl-ADP-ribose deacetylase [Parasporobacterium sp.]|nr:O-acetyl-ADP-ribose deacetylase [Parasporobacterium sp.]MBR3643052.1 O-acetyl-ADP-ribose deacetylase [Parasporobacterium sp.]